MNRRSHTNGALPARSRNHNRTASIDHAHGIRKPEVSWWIERPGDRACAS